MSDLKTSETPIAAAQRMAAIAFDQIESGDLRLGTRAFPVIYGLVEDGPDFSPERLVQEGWTYLVLKDERIIGTVKVKQSAVGFSGVSASLENKDNRTERALHKLDQFLGLNEAPDLVEFLEIPGLGIYFIWSVRENIFIDLADLKIQKEEQFSRFYRHRWFEKTGTPKPDPTPDRNGPPSGPTRSRNGRGVGD